ncbi:MAG TPA: MucR family transcriptional regulator [Rhizomicrobium sp.]|nr:MucR family transcriptional regulator [Rhizomicrobium sp.]
MSGSVSEPKSKDVVLKRMVDIVAAYVGRNKVTLPEVSNIIASVYASLEGLNEEVPQKKATPQIPAVPVKKSITPDYLVCLEDGKRVKMLKRYLRTSYGMTPAQYRAKWGLPVDYPMAAPNYTLARSDFAKKVGFGTKKARMARSAKKMPAK